MFTIFLLNRTFSILSLLLILLLLLGIIQNSVEVENNNHNNNENQKKFIKSSNKLTENAFDKLLYAFVQKYKTTTVQQQKETPVEKIVNSSMKSIQVDVNEQSSSALRPVNVDGDQNDGNDGSHNADDDAGAEEEDDDDDNLTHGNNPQHINYFRYNPKYENKTVCKSEYTWRDITLPWRILMKNLNPQCTHLLGNLIISGLDQEDDVTLLENIEEISGYLVIYGVGRKELRLPHLRLIRGLDYVPFKSRKVALLVVSNYKRSNEHWSESSESDSSKVTMETITKSSDESIKAEQESLQHLQILEMTSLISIVQHGIYFYDNPGLCYTPFTLKWDEMVESSELQTIDLVAIHSNANIHLWYEYCRCKYLNLCINNKGNNQTTTDSPFSSSPPSSSSSSSLSPPSSFLFNASQTQFEETLNELSKPTDDSAKHHHQQQQQRKRRIKKRDINMSTEQHEDTINTTQMNDQNSTNTPSEIQTTDSPTETTSENLSEHPKMEQSTLNQSEESNTILYSSESISTNEAEVPQSRNFLEGDMLMTKIGAKLDDLYRDNNDLTSEEIHDETTDTVVETSSYESLLSTSSDTTVTYSDEAQSTTPTAVENMTTEYSMVHLINHTTTGQSYSYENDTFSTTASTTTMTITEQKTTATTMDALIMPENSSIQANTTTTTTTTTRNPNETSIIYPTVEPPNLPCHLVCPAIQGKRYCWGPGPDQCQAVHKCQVHLCEGSNWCFRARSYTYNKESSTHHSRRIHSGTNYGYAREQCCHSECAAGCHGPRAQDCNACLRQSNRGICTNSCPASKVYNKSTYTWKENPDGLLTLGSICVKSCPKAYLRDGDHCVTKCARPGYFAYHGECLPCPNSICPKICTLKEIESIKGVDYLRRKSLRAMENCTLFEGDIKLSMQSFIGDPFYNLSQADEGVQWKDLVIGLSKLEHITGSLYISAGSHAPWLTNLTFLSNVKIISGVSPNIQKTRTININLNHHLEFLGMTSLRKLGHPSLLITGNPRLCYVDTIDWTSLMTDELISPQASLYDNGDRRLLLFKKSLKSDVTTDNYWSTQISLPNRKTLRRRRPLKDSAIFVGGNAHFEFCRGRGAMCDEVCQSDTGCWGPGIQFCFHCKYWSVEHVGGQLCVQKCDDVPGFYTPFGKGIENGTDIVNQEEVLNVESNTLTTLESTSTTNILSNEITETTEISSRPQNIENKPSNHHILPSMQCQKCSPMCQLQKNTCYGPNDDQCVGGCQEVQDGPFCRAYCPPNKYADSTSKQCMECSTACTPPIDTGEDDVSINGKRFNQIISLTMQHHCSGSGDWPGVGGCYFCKRTVLNLEPKDSHHHLKCVNSCPFGTYLHVINLHHRGGSSVHPQSTVNLHMKKKGINESTTTTTPTTTKTTDLLFTHFPWSQTDAGLFHKFSTKIIEELANWLVNHTQPKLYGLAQICLPCNEQCYKEMSISMRKSIHQIGLSSVACYGPSPEQCVRCANANYQGRCVSACPIGTFPQKRFLSNLDFSQPNYLHTNRQSLDSVKSSVNWSECLPCHKECENGCTGSTAKECTRCRHVKVYLDSGMNSWLCNHTCPEFNPYKIQDIRTGDIVCSNDPYKIHIVVVVSAYNDSQATRDHLTSTGTIPILVEQLTDNNSEAIYLIGQFLHNRYLSTEMAGLLSAVSALLIMLALIVCIIYWTIRTRMKYIKIDTTEIEHDASKDEKTSATCLMRCEKFWTQGQPRPTVVKKAKEERRRTRGRDNQSGRSKFSFKDKLLNTLEWNNNGSQIRGGGGGIKSMETKEKTMEVLNEEISPMLLSNTLKPNMATLRIITESELIRGPSIGSGAFGTVYCGVWCPKLSKSKIDTLNDACSTVTTATTANGASPSTPSAATAAGTPCLSTSFSYDVNKQTNDMESLSTSTDENYFNLHIPVAIKVLSDSADPQTNKELLEEAKVMATVDHPCCVRFLALCLTSKLQLITQFLPMGSLLEFVKTRWDTIEVSSLFQWSEQIASGMAYLSSRGIIHRDLAARNVLVQSKDQVQITDFGLAKCLDTNNSEYHASGGRMPIKWLAIECIHDRIFSSKSDVWAYGVTLWEMCTFGQRPYENIPARDLLSFLEKGNRLPQPETTSLDFYCLMLQCWHTDPNYRPTFKELCLVLCEMKATPSRYLFIMPELRLYNSNSSQQTSTSQSAFEFLSSRLSDIVIPSSPLPSQPLPTQSILPTNPTNHQTDLSHELTNHDEYTNYTDYNEYTQLHYDWIKNLYINSRANLFPDCFSTLLDNYNNYLIGTNISNSDDNKYNNANTKYQNNYIKFQNKVFELPRQNQVFNDQGIKKCRHADDDGNTDSVRCLINNDENTSVHASPRQQEYTNIEKADNKDLEYLEIGLQQQQQRESTENNLLPLLKNDQCGIFTFNTEN